MVFLYLRVLLIQFQLPILLWQRNSVCQVKEQDIINLFHQDPAGLDDCAQTPLDALPADAGEFQLITSDSMAEGTHFRRDWSEPEDLAVKLLHSNLSDLMVGGGEPGAALLNLGLPQDLPQDFTTRFAKRLLLEMNQVGVKLIGGDTFRSTDIQLSMTLLGRAGRPLKRSGGQAGDSLYLTGKIGLALAGYRVLAGKIQLSDTPLPPAALSDWWYPGLEQQVWSPLTAAKLRHLAPRARVSWARRLKQNPAVHAAMDLSDGLLNDAPRLARASGMDLLIDLDRLPIPGFLDMLPRDALGSGEEYEILFLGEPGLEFDFACREIGESRSKSNMPRVQYRENKEWIELEDNGYQHF